MKDYEKGFKDGLYGLRISSSKDSTEYRSGWHKGFWSRKV
jgi:hypothetical protein